jgi:predicted RNA-binding Zn-ribbon protein involved in translation (DUF1610 family)
MPSKSNKVLFRRDPSFARCPSCASINTLHRSRSRNWREAVVKSLSLFKIYRCNKCGWRGYLSTLIITWLSVRNLMLYIALAIVAGMIVTQVLKRFIQ